MHLLINNSINNCKNKQALMSYAGNFVIKQSYNITVKGVVQGIGFRPFIYRLAKKHKCDGFVKNSRSGVEIFLFRIDLDILKSFCDDMKELSPAGAIIQSIDYKKIENKDYSGFHIIKSEHTEGLTAIPPDLAICPECIKDISESGNRRFRYPFTNCTNCGPRYSIIKNIPYDRSQTTMSEFEMCNLCHNEYKNADDRRYHAQPVCCPECGPEIMLNEQKGLKALESAADIINKGDLLILKGLGGYQIVCDATNDEAVNELRKLKKRPNKPLAVMLQDVSTIKKHINPENNENALQILDSPSAPIVIENWGKLPLSAHINPIGGKIGIMKAYTPLHHLLFSFLNTDFIVATSGNLSDEPICINEREAFDKLSHFSKNFLIHNRPIHIRVDDSVVTPVENNEYMLRRARGYSPLPVILPTGADSCIAGMGAHLKSSITLAKNEYAFISQYIGDLDNTETSDFYAEVYEKMNRLFSLKPKILIRDIHPDYFSSKFAEKTVEAGTVTIQHHHAHMYACMAEHGIKDNVIGVIFDGTGLGTDGNIWGGEFFLLNGELSRQFHLKNYLQPGLDSAAKFPGRMLAGYLYQMNLLDKHINKLSAFMDEKDVTLIKKMVDKNLNCISTSSGGRLFEAVGSLLCNEEKNEFEGFTAILLENMIKDDEEVLDYYSWELNGKEIDFRNFFEEILCDIDREIPKETIAKKFHNSIAVMITQVCKNIKKESGCSRVVLSGGVFQNIYLLKKTKEFLQKSGFKTYMHKKIPANDGGISLGQVYKYILDNR